MRHPGSRSSIDQRAAACFALASSVDICSKILRYSWSKNVFHHSFMAHGGRYRFLPFFFAAAFGAFAALGAGGGTSLVLMSSTAFQAPSVCFRKTVTYEPESVIGFFVEGS